MTLIDGDRIVTAQLYDDEYEEFIEKEMSIIEFLTAYTNEGVTIADVKTLEQEPKAGHWQKDRVNVRCSNCGKGYREAFGRVSAITYNYCPNCGAKMTEK